MVKMHIACIIGESRFRIEVIMCRLLNAVLVLMVLLVPAQAGTAMRTPAYGEVAAAIERILNGQERLPLPLERIRPALKAHYIRDKGTIYWIGSGRMTPFLQRLADAEDDGLNPADYPVDSLIGLRDAIEPSDSYGAAQAELFFSAFFLNYAADLKIGRVTPQKVDPRLFRSRKSIDVLRVLTELTKCGFRA